VGKNESGVVQRATRVAEVLPSPGFAAVPTILNLPDCRRIMGRAASSHRLSRVSLNAPSLANRASQEYEAPIPRLKSTSRVVAGCSVRPNRLITSPIRRSASMAPDSERHIAKKSLAYRTRTPSSLNSARLGPISPPGWSLLPGAPALGRTGLSLARTMRLSGRIIRAIPATEYCFPESSTFQPPVSAALSQSGQITR
jgi:hypothetical protein